MLKKIGKLANQRRFLTLFLSYCLLTGSLMPAATAVAAEDMRTAFITKSSVSLGQSLQKAGDQSDLDKDAGGLTSGEAVKQSKVETVEQTTGRTTEQTGSGLSGQTVSEQEDQSGENSDAASVDEDTDRKVKSTEEAKIKEEAEEEAKTKEEAEKAETEKKESGTGEAGTEEAETEETETEEAETEEAETEEAETEEAETEKAETEEAETEEAVAEEVEADEETEADTKADKEFKLARKALQEILKDKTVMALVYLCDTYSVKKEPGLSAETAVTVSSGQTVEILDVSLTDQALWYRVRLYYEGRTVYTGYIQKEKLAYSDELLLAWEAKYLTSLLDPGKSPNVARRSRALPTYPDIEQFPESYRDKLYALKAQYPNWIFVRSNAKDSWDTAVMNEMLPPERSLIYYTAEGAWKDLLYDDPWYIASEQAVEYCMDPRNYFDEKSIFQFEQLTYNASYHTETALDSILSATFMNGRIPDEASLSFSQAFMLLGEQYGISPYHLAARVYQEQGTGNSPLISGTYPGFAGYYNYFNVGAYGIGEEVYLSGLRYASGQGWDTHFKSLSGGAATIGNNYIKKGQDSLYLQKFNVVSGVYYHQYMQNIQAPASEASKSWQLYKASNALNNPFVFKIPVYDGMPEDTVVEDVADGSADNSTDSVDDSSNDSVNDSADDSVKVTEIRLESRNLGSLEKDNYELKIGDSLAFAATVLPENAENRMVVWESDNTAAAIVDTDGKITSIGTGSAVISAAAADGSGVKASITIIVKDGVRDFRLDKNTVQLTAGETAVLVATVQTYSGKGIGVTWNSHDPDIASVDTEGKITAYGEGSTVITATAGDQELTCEVNVMPVTVTKEELPKEELPKEELPKEELPKEELPTEELPTEELPEKELPIMTLPKNEKLSAVQASYSLKPLIDNRYSEGYLQIKTNKGTILEPDYFTYQSSNEAAVLVDNDGRIVPHPDCISSVKTTVTVTASLRNDSLNRTVTFTVIVLPQKQYGQTGQTETTNQSGQSRVNKQPGQSGTTGQPGQGRTTRQTGQGGTAGPVTAAKLQLISAAGEAKEPTTGAVLTTDYSKSNLEICTLKAVYQNGNNAGSTGVNWSITNNSVAGIKINKDNTATVVMKKAGSVTVICQLMDSRQTEMKFTITATETKGKNK